MKKEQVEYSLDDFMQMDWGREVEPLIYFLNQSHDDLRRMYPSSPFKGQAPEDDVVNFHRDISYILGLLDSAPGVKQLQQVEIELTTKIVNVRSRVFMSNDLKAHVDIDTDNLGIFEKIWLDFIFIFLQRNWNEVLGRCANCQKWFKKSMKNQIYCSNNCKVKMHYKRNRTNTSKKYERSYKGKSS